MQQRFLFAGANTHKGFVDLFDNITDGYTYIMHGVPGCGKSTLLKTVAEHFSQKGENIEYFYCSADPESLDAIHIVNRKVAIVDGTAPHVRQSKNDGTDEIVLLFDKSTVPHDIISKAQKIQSRKKKLFAHAAKIHKRALDAHMQLEQLYRPLINFDHATKITRDLIASIENKS